MSSRKIDVGLIVFIQVVLLVLFVVFGTYDENNDLKAYPMFQDVHVMIFVGFGFLMTFLRRYGYSAVGFNFLLGALIIQWALLCQGFYQLDESHKIKVGIESLYKADIAAAAVLISMGAVLGRTSYLQLLVMGIVEIVVFSGNAFLGSDVFQVSDAGGSIFVHTFGAYFGLSVSYILNSRIEPTSNSLEGATYTSDIFAMIGTIFLWLFWPSFNSIEATGDGQQRAVINTYLSLASCCVTTFAVSLIFSKERKFDMVHVQNATLAGGVAVGTCADLMVQPYGAVAIGMVAGLLSVGGYAKLTPWMSSSLKVPDTCGVHNLHGMPGVLSGLLGTLMALIASESIYCKTLYEIYPARAPQNMTATPEYNFLKPGLGRTAGEQASYQILAVVVTLILAITSGLITGYFLKISKLGAIPDENFYDDDTFWALPEQHAPSKKASVVEKLAEDFSFEPVTKHGLPPLDGSS